MAYGTVKVDNITFTNGGVDQTITVSGIVQSISGDITATGTIQAATIIGTSTVSGATVTGNVGVFTSLTGGTAGFTTVTGTTVTGTDASFVNGLFTTQVSGTAVRGTTVSGATVTGTAGQFGTVTGNTAGFTTVTGTTITGSVANFVSGVFSAQVSGATVTGNVGSFGTITGGTVTLTSGVFGAGTAALPSISFTGDPNTGIYSPGADQVAISTNGTQRVTVDSSGLVNIGDSGQLVIGKGEAAIPTNSVKAHIFWGLDSIYSGTSGDLIMMPRSSAAANFRVYTGSTTPSERFRITGTGQLSHIGAGTSGSPAVSFSGSANSNSLVVDSNSRVGVGTSSPSAGLHVAANVSNAEFTRLGTQQFPERALRLSSFTSGGYTNTGILFNSPGATGFESTTAALAFATASQTRLYIDPTGRVGIGTTSPANKLTVLDGNIQIGSSNTTNRALVFADNYQTITGDGTTQSDLIYRTYTTHIWKNITGNGSIIDGSERMRLDISGRLLVGTSSAVGTDGLQLKGPAGGNAAFKMLGGNTASLSANAAIAQINFTEGYWGGTGAQITAEADAAQGNGDYPTRLVFSVTADGSASPTERLRINNSGAIGLSGANFGSAGQVLVSNGSSAAPTWEQITPSAVFGWDHDNDTYGLYLPGTSIRTGALSGTVDIDVQSRLRRCVINDSGVVQYYLDADDSTLKSGDWLRIVETQALNTAYTGTHSESTNSLLRVGVPAWAAGTFTRGQRVTHNGYLWECVVASTTATPAAGTVASNLSGADGQVMVEVPAFSVRYGYLNGVHTREIRLGCNASLIAQGFQPHPAFIKTDGTYKDAFYIGAYQVTGTSPATTVSGASNRVSMTRATQRSASAARGTGWHVLSYLELAAIQTLMVTEFRDMNTQRAIGNGAQEGSVYVVNTGLSNAAGNRSQNAYTSGGAVTDYISYRGLENIYGRAWQWTDGINVYERVVYLSNDQTAFADNTSVGYEFYAQVPSGSSSYQKELFALPDVFLPSVATGASSTTYLGDAFWTSTGWRVAGVGGASADGARVGAFTLSLSIGSGVALSYVSARLAYAAN